VITRPVFHKAGFFLILSIMLIADIFQKDQKNINKFKNKEITLEEFQKRATETCAEFYFLFKEKDFPFKSDNLESYKHAVVLTLHQPLERLEEMYSFLKKKTPEQVDPKDLAYMEDKIRVNKREKQVYGTQYKVKDGKIIFLPIQDEQDVDQRRRSVGLESLEEYKQKVERNL